MTLKSQNKSQDSIDYAIQTKDLTKIFKKTNKKALDSLSISIQKGKVTGLVGPDGAGKTTLMRLSAGLLTVTEGSITVLDEDPIKGNEMIRDSIGYMPQRFGLYENLSVLENLTLHADLKSLTKEQKEERFEKLLSFTDLKKFTSRMAGKLSGGMKQKLGLACALLGRPKLLLLDEPSVGVDPISRRELWRLVKDLSGEGMTVVWSTAYLDEADRCDAILLLNEGALMADGRPDELIEKIKNRTYLLSGSLDKRQLLKHSMKNKFIIDAYIQGDYLRVLLKEEPSKDFFTDYYDSSVQTTSIDANLEDIFMDVLGGIRLRESVLSQVMPDITFDESKPVIEANNLTKMYGDFTAADSISFTIYPGKIYGLLGPNGAGKSTTFKMLCGLTTPTSGDSEIMGKSFATEGTQIREKLGYMAQKFSLYTNLSAKQNLTFFSGMYGISGQEQQDKINQMLDLFDLQEYSDMESGTLPLGFKQRLALSCALIHQPPILFLDEPTSGVDPLTRREFWIHINGLVEKGVTIIVTTHFMEEAEYCDYIGLVYKGKIIAEGTPTELKKSVTTENNEVPTMEDTFVKLILDHED